MKHLTIIASGIPGSRIVDLPDSIDAEIFSKWVQAIGDRLCAGDKEYGATHMTYTQEHVVNNVCEELLDIPGWSYLWWDKLQRGTSPDA